MPERVRLAAADEQPERAVAAQGKVTGRKGHQFRAAGEQFVAERQHGPVAQAPDCVGLHRQEGIEIGPCQPLGLARAPWLLAPNAADRQVDVLGEGRRAGNLFIMPWPHSASLVQEPVDMPLRRFPDRIRVPSWIALIAPLPTFRFG